MVITARNCRVSLAFLGVVACSSIKAVESKIKAKVPRTM